MFANYNLMDHFTGKLVECLFDGKEKTFIVSKKVFRELINVNNDTGK
jgi:hypothetical protein